MQATQQEINRVAALSRIDGHLARTFRSTQITEEEFRRAFLIVGRARKTHSSEAIKAYMLKAIGGAR